MTNSFGWAQLTVNWTRERGVVLAGAHIDDPEQFVQGLSFIVLGPLGK